MGYRETLQHALELAQTAAEEAIETLRSLQSECVSSGNVRMAALVSKNAGLVCEREHRLDEAESFYLAALESDPADAAAMLGLVQLYRRMEKADLAEKWLRKGRAAAEQAHNLALVQTFDELSGSLP